MMLNIGAQMVLAKGKKDAVELGLQMAKMYDELERELTRTKRALWLARCERAVAEQTIHEFSRYREKHPYGFWWNKSFNEWCKMWIFVELKCRQYANKFREE